MGRCVVFVFVFAFVLVFVFVFLSRRAGNELGSEGAGRLAEPLGKLTALQHLDLRGTV